MCYRSLKALSHECCIGQHMKNELRLTHEKRMTLTKEKNNTHKQSTFTLSRVPHKPTYEERMTFDVSETNDVDKGEK